MHRQTAAAAALGALFFGLTAAQAAQVQVYGRIDTGIVYQNFFGDSTADDSLTMETGSNTASRVGIRGSEQITPDTSVAFRLENRFSSDTGEIRENGRLFGGIATLTLANKQWGEVAVGRMAGVGSGSGAYDLLIHIDAFDGGSWGTGVGSVRSSRNDNMITYRSPRIAGLQTTLQYSLKTDSSSEGDESTSDVNRFYAAGLHYNAGPLNVVGAFEGTLWGHKYGAAADANQKVATLGASYRFEPVTVYAQMQYFDGANKIDGFDVSDIAGQGEEGSVKGYGLYAGTQFWYGLSSWQSMVYWKDYEFEPSGSGRSYDGSTLAVATKIFYRPSKTIDMYVGGGYSQWDRVEDGKVLTDKGFNLFSGITKYF